MRLRLSLVLVLFAASHFALADDHSDDAAAGSEVQSETPEGDQPADETREVEEVKLELEEIEKLASVSTLAMRPVRIAQVAGSRPEIAKQLGTVVYDKLTRAGFSVIPPAAHDEIRDRINRDLGGIYDPITGRLIEERAKTLIEYQEREYNERYSPDGEVFVAVAVARATFKGNDAVWDGVRAPSTGKDGFLRKFTEGSGIMPALSLYVLIRDAEEKPLFAGGGGIELAAVLTGSGIDRIPPENLLNDQAKIEHAIVLTFEPFDQSADDINALRAEPSAGSDATATSTTDMEQSR